MAATLMHRSPLPTTNGLDRIANTECDNENLSFSSDDELADSHPQDSISLRQGQIPSSTRVNTRLTTANIAAMATSAITFTLLNTESRSTNQQIFNTVAAVGTGAVAYAALNSEVLRPLISKVDQWIVECVRMFQNWFEGEENLASQRHSHISPGDRFWNFLKNHEMKIKIGGIMIGGINYGFNDIIQFIKNHAPDKISQMLEKMINMRNKLDIIINSPAVVSAGIVAGLCTIAYGLYIAYGASQQLKKLNKISFEPVMDGFQKALDEFTTSFSAANGNKIRIKTAFSCLELSVMRTQAKLKSTIREVTYQHKQALEMKDRVKLVRNIALAVSTVALGGAIGAGAKAMQGGAGMLAAARVGLCSTSAKFSFLFISGWAACEFGSSQCQLVIDKCEELQKEGSDLSSIIATKLIQLKGTMEEQINSHANNA